MIDPSYSMTKIIHMAVDQWIEDLESQEISFAAPGGYTITKHVGQQFPERPNNALRQGQARSKEREALKDRASGHRSSTTARLKIGTYNKLQDAVFWRDTLRSHDIEQALLAWFERNQTGRAI